MKKDEQLVAVNHISSSEPFFMVKSGELMKQLTAKDEYFERDNPLDLPVNLGFMMKSGPEALKHRRIFSQFFVQKHLDKITPMIEKYTIQKVELIKKDLLKQSGGDPQKFVKVEMQKYWRELFSEIVNYIMFGNKDYPEIDGMTVPKAVAHLIGITTKEINQNPINLLLFTIPSRLGLLPQCKPMKELYEKIEKACIEMYRKRTRLSPEERSCNLVDLMVEHNLNCPEDEVLDEEIIKGNLFAFQIAGMDTSRQVTLTTLHYLSKHPDLYSELSNEIRKSLFQGGEAKMIGGLENLDNSVYFNNFLREALRLFSAVPLAFPRIAKKNIKIGKYKIYKGSSFMMAFTGPQYNPENFRDPKTFKVDRFADTQKLAKDLRKGTYIPFSSGNRECIGKYLAEIFIKVGLSHFLREFEIAAVEDFHPRLEMGFNYGLQEVWVQARPRGGVAAGGDPQ